MNQPKAGFNVRSLIEKRFELALMAIPGEGWIKEPGGSFLLDRVAVAGARDAATAWVESAIEGMRKAGIFSDEEIAAVILQRGTWKEL